MGMSGCERERECVCERGERACVSERDYEREEGVCENEGVCEGERKYVCERECVWARVCEREIECG